MVALSYALGDSPASLLSSGLKEHQKCLDKYIHFALRFNSRYFSHMDHRPAWTNIFQKEHKASVVNYSNDLYLSPRLCSVYAVA